jgi:hypothetical protein
MRRYFAVLLWTVTATLLPGQAAYASETPESQSLQAATVSDQPAVLDLGSPVVMPRIGPGTRLPSFRSRLNAPASSLRADDYRYDSAKHGAAGPAINFAPAESADSAGWHASWRLGPVRGLTPLDHEGESKMRFGGRLPGQPRIPGTGIVNFAMYYAY